LFLHKGLRNPHIARTLLSWRHSGVSIDSGTHIYDEDSHRSVSRYIMRARLSRTTIEWDDQEDTVTWKAPQKGYFKGRERHISCLDFIAQLTLHIPPAAGICCAATACIPPSAGSRFRSKRREASGRGTWKDRPALASRAPRTGTVGRPHSLLPRGNQPRFIG